MNELRMKEMKEEKEMGFFFLRWLWIEFMIGVGLNDWFMFGNLDIFLFGVCISDWCCECFF